MRAIHILLFLFPFLFISCSDETGAFRKTEFFNLSEFLDLQDSLLTQSGKSLKKTLTENSGKSVNEVEKPTWEEEFRILKDFELDKNANQGEYSKDSSTNKIEFRLIQNRERLKVKHQIILLYPSGKIKTIKSQRKEENLLYRSQTKMLIELSPEGLIESYRLDFEKKVIMLDPESFSVEVEVF